MYYCKEKNRWIIQGEEESDDDVPPPPPPKVVKAAISQPDVKVEQEKKPEAVGLNSLTTPVFGGALANRNRGKKPVNAATRPLSTFPVPAQAQ